MGFWSLNQNGKGSERDEKLMRDNGNTKQKAWSDKQVLTRRNAVGYMQEKTVKIPVEYRKIGAEAFKSNIKMEKLMLHNGMLELGTDAFRYNRCVREAQLPHSIRQIGKGCFADCPALRMAYIPNSLEYIPEDLFKEDRRLRKVLFTKTNQTREIKKNAFYECSSLEGILLPPKLRIIGEGAFYRCKSLKHVRFPEGLKCIGKDAFYFCGLEELELPESLEVLEERAFFKCTYLTEVRLPTNIRRIEKWVFHGCSRLQVLEIRHDPEYIGEWIINKAARIRCYKGSKVDVYCQEAGFTVEYIE